MTLPHAPLPKLTQSAKEVPLWFSSPFTSYTRILEGATEDGRTVWLFEPDFAKRGFDVLHPDCWSDGSKWDAKAGYVWRYGRE